MRHVFHTAMESLNLHQQNVPLAVAVSGGVDSMALAHLASQYNGGNILAITVDHAIRKESSDEAQSVNRIMSSLHIPHKIIKIDWEGEFSTLVKCQEVYRQIRYNILIKECVKGGFKHLLVAHHRDDQIETGFCRLSHHSGIFGLGGMRAISPAPYTVDGGSEVKIVRPLLRIEKDDLIGYCRDLSIDWMEDSSNESDVYTRNRIRKGLNSLLESQSVISKSDLSYLAEFCGRSVELIETRSRIFSSHHLQLNRALGYAKLSRDALLALPPPVIHHILCNTTVLISGQRYSLSRNGMSNLLTHLRSRKPSAAAFRKCLFVPEKEHVLVYRQPPQSHHQALIPVVPGKRLLFDGRFSMLVSVPESYQSVPLFVRPFNGDTDYLFLKEIRSDTGVDVKKCIPHLCLRSLPVVVSSDTRKIIFIPHSLPFLPDSPFHCHVQLQTSSSLLDDSSIDFI